MIKSILVALVAIALGYKLGLTVIWLIGLLFIGSEVHKFKGSKDHRPKGLNWGVVQPS